MIYSAPEDEMMSSRDALLVERRPSELNGRLTRVEEVDRPASAECGEDQARHIGGVPIPNFPRTGQPNRRVRPRSMHPYMLLFSTLHIVHH